MSSTPATGLYPALLSAQKAMGPVKKDASNPAFRSKYASLQSILDTIEGPLQDNGLVLLQRFQQGPDGPVLFTEIVHAASEKKIESWVAIVGKDMTDPQKIGSAITYYRRYSLLALLGLTPEEDDDGNSASQPAPRKQQPQPAPTPRPASQAAPANGSAPPTPFEHPLIKDIRDKRRNVKDRVQSLHDYLMGAHTTAELNKRYEAAKGSGLPDDRMTAAFNWHADRLDKDAEPEASPQMPHPGFAG